MREAKQNKRSLATIRKGTLSIPIIPHHNIDLKTGFHYTSRNFKSLRKNSEFVLLTHLKSVHQVTIPTRPHFKVFPKPVDTNKEEIIMTRIEDVLQSMRKYGKREKELIYVKR